MEKIVILYVLTLKEFLYTLLKRGNVMNKYMYIVLLSVFSFVFSAQTNAPDALSWYGYNSLTADSQYSNDYFGNKDDEVFRKRRHRRRRKISPEKKGW